MNAKLSNILQDCLQAMEGGMSLDECLTRYPSLASDLRPLLESAQAARTAGLLPVPGNAVTRGKARVLVHAARLRQDKRRPRPHLTGAWRMAVASLAVLAFLVLTGNGLIAASANALPGDPLYAVKRTVEDARLSMASDPQAEAQIQEEITTRRVEETESLLSEQRVEDVEFEGLVSEQLPDGWRIAGIAVVVTNQTEMEGVISIGVIAEVTGQTQPNGSLLAEHIRVEDQESGAPEGGSASEETATEQAEETPAPDQTDDNSSHGSDDGDSGEGDSGSGSEDATKTPEPDGNND